MNVTSIGLTMGLAEWIIDLPPFMGLMVYDWINMGSQFLWVM